MADKWSRRRFLQTTSAVGAATALGSFGCAPPPPTATAPAWSLSPGERYALTNVHVVDVVAGKLLENRTVVISGGKIESLLGPEDPEPMQARKIDGGGTYMIPGMINAHTHIASAPVGRSSGADFSLMREQTFLNYENCIAWGVTTVRDLGSMPKFLSRDREKINAGTLIGPNILTSMGFVSVPGGYPEFFTELPWLAKAVIGNPAREARTPAEARDQVKRYHDLGSDLVKIAFDHKSNLYGRGAIPALSDAQVEAIKDEATKLGIPVAAHHMYALGLDRGVQFEVDSLEHIAFDHDLTEAQIEKVVALKTPIVPTTTAGINLAYPTPSDPYKDDPNLRDAIEFREKEIVAEVPKHCGTEVAKMCQVIGDYYGKEWYALPENQDKQPFDPRLFTQAVVVGSRNLSRVISAGAVIGAGNDAGVPRTFPGMLHFELLLLRRAGLTDAQALRAATSVNAKLCNVADRCGTVDPGKDADLVLLESDPLKDIRAVEKVKAVFKHGKLLSKADGFELTV
jgi:imidazolonepropionase-like amidohydrolase